VGELNAGHKLAAVQRKYSTTDNPLSQSAIRRCYQESLHHFRSRELTQASLDYYEVERSLAAEQKKDTPDKDEVQRLRKHKQALRREMLSMKETLQARAFDGGPRLLAGELVGINVRDEQSWPDWLPIFTLKWFDAIIEDVEKRQAAQAIKDLQGTRVGANSGVTSPDHLERLPRRRIKQAVTANRPEVEYAN
jgi:hypothetical protein